MRSGRRFGDIETLVKKRLWCTDVKKLNAESTGK